MSEIPTTSSEDLKPHQRPVEIKLGREGVTQAKAALGRFESHYLPNLPLGEKTKQDLTKIVETVSTNPDSLLMFDAHGGRFLDIDRKMHGEATEETLVELSPRDLESRQNDVNKLLEESGLHIGPVQLKELIYDWIVWHELGHGVQAAYAVAAPRYPQDRNYRDPADLVKDTWQAGVAEPYPVPAKSSAEYVIESERFAEGFARYLVGLELQRLGFDADDSRKFLQAMQDFRANSAKDTEKLLAEAMTAEAQGEGYSYAQFSAELKKLPNGSVNQIGYTHAHNPETTKAILRMTAKFEDLPSEERTADKLK